MVQQKEVPRTPLERAPRADLGWDPIPKGRYLDRNYMEAEFSDLWPRVWLLAGFERYVARPGDYATFELGGESVVAVRQEGGALQAFHNVCMHRGNRLVEPGLGRAKRFTCLFHGWRYGVDGALDEALDAETFPQGCPGESLDLRPVRCECWGGFYWINFDDRAPPLREYLDVIPSHLDPYHFEEMKIVGDYTLEIDANWKTSVDAFHEAYHIYGTHPDTLGVNDDVNVPIDCYRQHSRMLLKLAVASPRHPDHGKVTDPIREHFWRQRGSTAKASKVVQRMFDRLSPRLCAMFRGPRWVWTSPSSTMLNWLTIFTTASSRTSPSTFLVEAHGYFGIAHIPVSPTKCSSTSSIWFACPMRRFPGPPMSISFPRTN